MTQKSKHSVACQQVLKGGAICFLPNSPDDKHCIFTYSEWLNFVLSSNPPLLHIHTESGL